MKYYDFAKAAQLIEAERANGLKEAELGMYNDWYWTAQTVFEEGEYKKDLATVTEIAGIPGSGHDQPVLKLTFQDDTVRTVDCYHGSSDYDRSPMAGYGGMFEPSGNAGLPEPTEA